MEEPKEEAKPVWDKERQERDQDRANIKKAGASLKSRETIL